MATVNDLLNHAERAAWDLARSANLHEDMQARRAASLQLGKRQLRSWAPLARMASDVLQRTSPVGTTQSNRIRVALSAVESRAKHQGSGESDPGVDRLTIAVTQIRQVFASVDPAVAPVPEVRDAGVHQRLTATMLTATRMTSATLLNGTADDENVGQGSRQWWSRALEPLRELEVALGESLHLSPEERWSEWDHVEARSVEGGFGLVVNRWERQAFAHLSSQAGAVSSMGVQSIAARLAALNHCGVLSLEAYADGGAGGGVNAERLRGARDAWAAAAAAWPAHIGSGGPMPYDLAEANRWLQESLQERYQRDGLHWMTPQQLRNSTENPRTLRTDAWIIARASASVGMHYDKTLRTIVKNEILRTPARIAASTPRQSLDDPGLDPRYLEALRKGWWIPLPRESSEARHLLATSNAAERASWSARVADSPTEHSPSIPGSLSPSPSPASPTPPAPEQAFQPPSLTSARPPGPLR